MRLRVCGLNGSWQVKRPVAEIESEIDCRRKDLLRRLREATASEKELSYGAQI
jgi:hypothetical protein